MNVCVRGRGLRAAAIVGAASLLIGLALVSAGCGSSVSTTPSSGPPSATSSAEPASSSILEAARALGLSAFVRAARAAGLESTLGGEASYTVLVPNNRAFRRIDLGELMSDAQRLKALMDYLVLPAVRLSPGGVKDGEKVPTLSGQSVVFSVKKGAVKVDGADVVKAVQGPGWTVLVIDKVLSPSGTSAPSPSPSP